jgi:hypothetical protein
LVKVEAAGLDMGSHGLPQTPAKQGIYATGILPPVPKVNIPFPQVNISTILNSTKSGGSN